MTDAAVIRARLSHPIVDADGHFVELGPIVDDEIASYLEDAGGAALRDKYLAGAAAPFDTSVAAGGRERATVTREWRAMPSWWGWQTRNTLDRATAHLPKLLYQRLDDLGIDVSILYPSTTLSLLDLEDPELAGAVARGVNRWLARTFAPYRDRLVVGGLVPMKTPEVAVATLRDAVDLGFRAIVMTGYAKRFLGEATTGPDDGPRPYRLDTFGIDSEFDYDPFWAACVELGVAPVSHSSHQQHRVGRSISNYVYNHVGGLAAGHESLAKSLFLGGVTRRFPSLRVGFLEGGVAWACSTYADLLAHWEKRNATAIRDLDPDRLDVDGLVEYLARYGDEQVEANLGRLRQFFSRPGAQPAALDEFARAEIEKPEDIRALFVDRFYFGCEADDPLVTWAFAERVNPLGARLRPVFGSDISHWDVPDMTEPVPEAWELVERKLIDEEQFRQLTFTNAVRLHAGMNPRFFEGTVCEAAAAELVGAGLD